LFLQRLGRFAPRGEKPCFDIAWREAAFFVCKFWLVEKWLFEK